MKEKKLYRENLEMILAKFPGHIALTIDEACQCAGVKDRRTLLKDPTFPARLISGKYAITVTAMANYLCG